MSTIELTLDVPSDVSRDEAKLLLAIKLYEVGRVSLGQAAKLAGLPKREFIAELGRYGVALFDYPPAELRQEVGS